MGEKDFSSEDLIDPKWVYMGMICSALCFEVINRIVAAVAIPSKLSTEQWIYKNILVSWIHSLIVGTLDLTVVLIYPDLRQDPVAFYNASTYSVVTLSVGYFLYDLIDQYRNGAVLSNWGVSVHHVMIIILFTHHLHTCTCVGLTCIALLPEVNSVFLHFRKLLQYWKVDFNSTIYRHNVWINMITFLIFRFFVNIWLLYNLFTSDWHERLSFSFLVTFYTSGLVWTPMNVVIFQGLLRKDFLCKKEHYKKSSNTNGINNNEENGKIVSNGVKKTE